MQLSNAAEYARIKKRILETGPAAYYEKIRNGNFCGEPTYHALLDVTREERQNWWREARFGIFVHYGLFSVGGRGEWDLAWNGTPRAAYDAQLDGFTPRPDAAKRWAECAAEAGARYIVLTTRHHDGFSLWDSRVNPYNSVQLGPHRDLVGEFVEAARACHLKVGLYSSLMDWHHPDGAAAKYDPEARARFLAYLEALNTELLTCYGKIDILWYDMPYPMQGADGWNALTMNQRLRALQPHILLNNRSGEPEDFSTPEENLQTCENDWESCLTFNQMTWGYADSAQMKPYSYTVQQLIEKLSFCARNRGNLLLNIGPKPDGGIPGENLPELQTLGKWLRDNGEAVYGSDLRSAKGLSGGCAYALYGGPILSRQSAKGNTVYIWQLVWPDHGILPVNGYRAAPRSVRLLRGNVPVDFSYENGRILLKNLPKNSPDPHANIPVFALDFAEEPDYCFCAG